MTCELGDWMETTGVCHCVNCCMHDGVVYRIVPTDWTKHKRSKELDIDVGVRLLGEFDHIRIRSLDKEAAFAIFKAGDDDVTYVDTPTHLDTLNTRNIFAVWVLLADVSEGNKTDASHYFSNTRTFRY